MVEKEGWVVIGGCENGCCWRCGCVLSEWMSDEENKRNMRGVCVCWLL